MWWLVVLVLAVLWLLGTAARRTATNALTARIAIRTCPQA